jgi:hypothetical protein
LSESWPTNNALRINGSTSIPGVSAEKSGWEERFMDVSDSGSFECHSQYHHFPEKDEID